MSLVDIAVVSLTSMGIALEIWSWCDMALLDEISYF